jgi:hypothetical protein
MKLNIDNTGTNIQIDFDFGDNAYFVDINKDSSEFFLFVYNREISEFLCVYQEIIEGEFTEEMVKTLMGNYLESEISRNKDLLDQINQI